VLLNSGTGLGKTNSHTHPLFGPTIGAICKVMKTQHQNPEFGHTQGEIQKQPAK
jgi:hypothetical protein